MSEIFFWEVFTGTMGGCLVVLVALTYAGVFDAPEQEQGLGRQHRDPTKAQGDLARRWMID